MATVEFSPSAVGRSLRSNLEPGAMSPVPDVTATRRRAFTVGDRDKMQRSASASASAAKRAVSTAFSNVTRFVKSSSMSNMGATSSSSTSKRNGDNTEMDDNDATPPPPPVTRGRANTTTAATTDSAPQVTSSRWRLPTKLPTKLPSVPGSFKNLRRTRGSPFQRSVAWHSGHVQYVAGSSVFHGEDAGAISSYYHIVADGISLPFDRTDPTATDDNRVSSAIIAKELVRCVEAALEDFTNRNKVAIDDASALERLVTDAIRATTMTCFPYRKSRIATTLSVVYFDRWHAKVHVFTLGDSKCLIVRQGDVVFESTATLREFNVPCVVNLVNGVDPSDYVVETFELLQDDLCLTFTDGISDNLYKEELLAVVAQEAGAGVSLQHMCDQLVTKSQADETERASLAIDQVDDDDVAARLPSSQSTGTTTTEPDAEAISAGDLVELELDVTPTSCTAARLHTGNSTFEDGEDGTTSHRRFFPFATAAAREFHARALLSSACSVDVEEDARRLLALHQSKTKSVLDCQRVVMKPNRRAHYSLAQLQRMAQLETRKPDDITLYMTRFA